MGKMKMIALTIAGSDSGGGAGIQADLKTFAMQGVHGLSIILALTAQNTREVKSIYELPERFIEEQFRALHDDFEIKAAKTGMLYSEKIIKAVVKNISDYPLVVDPVIIAESGAPLLKENAINVLKKKLLPKALITTPNIFEAEKLSGIKIESEENMKAACKKIAEFDCSVVVKGGHLNARDILYHNGRFYEFEGRKIEARFHGAGCSFSASIAANLAKGYELVKAVKNAKEFITKALENAENLGKSDVRVVNQSRHFIELAEKYCIIEELKKAVNHIESNEKFAELIPEVGSNICYASENAKKLSDVAGVSGRIIRIKNKAKAAGSIEFGASKHVARIVLTAMKYDRSIRAAMNIKYKEKLIEEIKRKKMFKISKFEREEEPENVKTMEWGTEQAIKKLGYVPDFIYDKGAKGKEAMIRILGENPSDVLRKAEKIIAMRYFSTF